MSCGKMAGVNSKRHFTFQIEPFFGAGTDRPEEKFSQVIVPYRRSKFVLAV